MREPKDVGAILIADRPRITQFLGLEGETYSGQWSVVRGSPASLWIKIHAAVWNLFFMAAGAKVMFFGSIGANQNPESDTTNFREGKTARLELR